MLICRYCLKAEPKSASRTSGTQSSPPTAEEAKENTKNRGSKAATNENERARRKKSRHQRPVVARRKLPAFSLGLTQTTPSSVLAAVLTIVDYFVPSYLQVDVFTAQNYSRLFGGGVWGSTRCMSLSRTTVTVLSTFRARGVQSHQILILRLHMILIFAPNKRRGAKAI